MMTIYKVDYRGSGRLSRGFSFHASHTAAYKAGKDAVKAGKCVGQEDANPIISFEVEQLLCPLTKQCVLRMLNAQAGHADNG